MIQTESKIKNEPTVSEKEIYHSLLKFQNASLCSSFYFDYQVNPTFYTPRKKSHFEMSTDGKEPKIEQLTTYASLVTELEINEMVESIDLVDLEASIVTLLEVLSNKVKLVDSKFRKLADENTGMIQVLEVIIQRLNKLRIEVGRLNSLKREGHDVPKQLLLVLYLLNNIFKDNKNSSELYSRYFTMAMGY